MTKDIYKIIFDNFFMEKIMKYTTSEIAFRLNSLDGWKQEGDFIVKTFVFKDFSEAFGFLGRVGLISEVIAHHPDWSGVYNKVTLKLTTHDVGGITDKDFDFAERVEHLFK